MTWAGNPAPFGREILSLIGTQFHQPRTIRQGGGEVHGQPAAGPHLGGQRAGVVDHHQVARQQQAGQVAESTVTDLLGSAPADQQPDAVPGQAARLGRVVRLELGGQGEVERS